MRTGGLAPESEAAHQARLKDLMVYRVAFFKQRAAGEPVGFRLFDSGGYATVTLRPEEVMFRPGGTVSVTRATALAHGLGLPDEIRRAER